MLILMKKIKQRSIIHRNLCIYVCHFDEYTISLKLDILVKTILMKSINSFCNKFNVYIYDN